MNQEALGMCLSYLQRVFCSGTQHLLVITHSWLSSFIHITSLSQGGCGSDPLGRKGLMMLILFCYRGQQVAPSDRRVLCLH